MDLAKRLLADLDDVTTLYERKLCSLGVVQLKLSRTAAAARMDHPHWVDPLLGLAQRAASLEAEKASWMTGMELVDAVRRFVKSPPEAPRPRLALVRDEAPAPEVSVDGALPEPVVDEEPAAEPEVAVRGPVGNEGVPDDPTEPARPSLVPCRSL